MHKIIAIGPRGGGGRLPYTTDRDSPKSYHLVIWRPGLLPAI